MLRDQGFGPALQALAEQVGTTNRIRIDLDVGDSERARRDGAGRALHDRPRAARPGGPPRAARRGSRSSMHATADGGARDDASPTTPSRSGGGGRSRRSRSASSSSTARSASTSADAGTQRRRDASARTRPGGRLPPMRRGRVPAVGLVARGLHAPRDAGRAPAARRRVRGRRAHARRQQDRRLPAPRRHRAVRLLRRQVAERVGSARRIRFVPQLTGSARRVLGGARPSTSACARPLA